jgi:MYXO-CTERM domain-containing protein
MKRPRVGLIALLLSLPCGAAQAQDASITLYLRASAASAGAFNQTGTIGTQVHVFARSSRSAMYNSSTNIYAPTVGKVSAGGTFTVQIPNLYSSSRYVHNYTIELDWPDSSTKMVSLGPTPIAAGANNYGVGGLGSTAPIDVRNDYPAAVTGLNCYPDLPDKSTQIYISWSSGLRPLDYSRTELHLSTSSGFTPSALTLVRTPPWGTSSQKLTGLTPQTGYYYCIRSIDQYGGASDACSTAPCTTAAGMPGGSDGGVTPGDGGGMPEDGGVGIEDGGQPGPDQGPFGGEDGGAPGGELPPVGSVPVGCGCSLTPSSAAPAGLLLSPALLLLLRRRRRTS